MILFCIFVLITKERNDITIFTNSALPLTANKQPDIIALSGNRLTPKDVNDMEVTILNTLDWQLHPPTTTTFVHVFLSFLDGLTPGAIALLLEHVSYITELAACGENKSLCHYFPHILYNKCSRDI